MQETRIVYELIGNFYFFRTAEDNDYFIIYALKPGIYFDFGKADLVWSFMLKYDEFERLAKKTKKFWHVLYFVNKNKNNPEYYLMKKTTTILTHEKYVKKIPLLYNNSLYYLFMIHGKLFVPEELDDKIDDMLIESEKNLIEKSSERICYDDFDMISDEKIKFVEIIEEDMLWR